MDESITTGPRGSITWTYVVFFRTVSEGKSGSNEATNESMKRLKQLRWFLEKRMDGKTTSAFVLGILDWSGGLSW